MTFKTAGLKLASLALAGLLLAGTAARADTVVNRGNGAEPETLDPQKLTGVPEANIAYDLYEGLATLDDHGNPTGGVAKSWDVSDDGKVYTFHLRDDAKWSNGDPITADDVVYSLRRVVDPKVAAEYAYIYAPILNADEINSGKETDLTKLGVEAVDPHTVKITLKAPTPYLLGLLAHTSSQIVNKAAVEKCGDQWTRPGNNVTSGAYTITEWVAAVAHRPGQESELPRRGQCEGRQDRLLPDRGSGRGVQALPRRRARHHLRHAEGQDPGRPEGIQGRVPRLAPISAPISTPST